MADRPARRPPGRDTGNGILADALEEREKRLGSYRERALALFPWVCARCGREFTGKRLRELTVHHKDHDHEHNPPDGSNWELLCLYCHDNEHERMKVADANGEARREEDRPRTTFKPFANLERLLGEKK